MGGFKIWTFLKKLIFRDFLLARSFFLADFTRFPLLDYTRRARVARRTDCVGTTLIFLRTSAHVTITLERDGSGQVGHLDCLPSSEETQNVRNGPGFDLGSSPRQANYAQRASRTECDRQTDDGRTDRRTDEQEN